MGEISGEIQAETPVNRVNLQKKKDLPSYFAGLRGRAASVAKYVFIASC